LINHSDRTKRNEQTAEKKKIKNFLEQGQQD